MKGFHTISVTKEDIKNGVVCSCKACPVALALQRYFGRKCFVGTNGISIQYLGLFEQPQIIRKFVKNFNSGKPVEPFSFELEI